ncbi:hypothetical protein AAT19DRAFT_12338 [Rhodotorula toruloides]|uniref:Uncharacterized protein n=1 Tax=Rhodotorula toruloides TaxID=5286 RepID=A0A2T0AG02_RHOTO|nr:hypothetical protein AAT19DRAFT_12338 [Rhodotorula toruloides]
MYRLAMCPAHSQLHTRPSRTARRRLQPPRQPPRPPRPSTAFLVMSTRRAGLTDRACIAGNSFGSSQLSARSPDHFRRLASPRPPRSHTHNPHNPHTKQFNHDDPKLTTQFLSTLSDPYGGGFCPSSEGLLRKGRLILELFSCARCARVCCVTGFLASLCMARCSLSAGGRPPKVLMPVVLSHTIAFALALTRRRSARSCSALAHDAPGCAEET